MMGIDGNCWNLEEEKEKKKTILDHGIPRAQTLELFTVTSNLPKHVTILSNGKCSLSKGPVRIRNFYCVRGLRYLTLFGSLFSQTWDSHYVGIFGLLVQHSHHSKQSKAYDHWQQEHNSLSQKVHLKVHFALQSWFSICQTLGLALDLKLFTQKKHH